MYPRNIEPSFAIPPGETIKETLDELDMTPSELAERIGVSSEDMRQLLKGDLALSDEIADALERELGVGAGFWRRLEEPYSPTG